MAGTVAVVLVAAGRGRRLGGEIPKQYLPLGGASALRRSAERFLSVAEVGAILPVIHGDDADLAAGALAGLGERLMPWVEGGETRSTSVRNGLESLKDSGVGKVLIHDAARPFVSVDVIEAVIAALDTAEGAFAAVPVVDALWASEGRRATATVPREGLWRAQTPQGFDFARILAAHRAHAGAVLDDVAVARAAGMEVAIVPGSEGNYKITTQDDLIRACRELGVPLPQGGQYP